jgi:predicted transcriptional regulator
MKPSPTFNKLNRFLERHPVEDVERFWEDDSGYRDWVTNRPDGYVFNVVRDGKLVLHKATCGAITDFSRRMAVFGIKVCSKDQDSLESLCRAAFKQEPRRCRLCFPEDDRPGNGSTRNFHLPLPAQVYSLLRDEASRANRPATVLARQAIEDWLRQRRKAATHDAIAAYVAEMAGTGADLDPALEAASLECLAESERRP